jgi:hypothetical protein
MEKNYPITFFSFAIDFLVTSIKNKIKRPKNKILSYIQTIIIVSRCDGSCLESHLLRRQRQGDHDFKTSLGKKQDLTSENKIKTKSLEA